MFEKVFKLKQNGTNVRTEVVDLTGLGILEMTRQKTSRPLADILEK